MKNNLFYLIYSFLITVILGIIFIPVLKRKKAGQTVLKYVTVHKSKNGTPTFGGFIFMIPTIAVYFLFNGYDNAVSNAVCFISVCFAFIGFIDDFIKVKNKDNQGLKVYQKLILQLVVGIIGGIFAFQNKITFFFTPFFFGETDLAIFSIFIFVFIYIAITNSVNLTDGLDGLCSTTTVSNVILFILLIFSQVNLFGSSYLPEDELYSLISLSFCLLGSILGFLCFNVNKANIFMGDTGSLFLGGFIGSLFIFSGNSFFIPFIGIMFLISSLSVIIQVLHFKRTKNRVFLMTPIHHHFQLKGITEGKISYIYFVITLIIGLLSIITYMR